MGVQDIQEAVRASDLFSHILLKALNLHLIDEISEHQVSLAQLQAIRFLRNHSVVMMGNLAAGLSISYPSATNMVKRLEKRGLAKRRVNPTDKREVQVALTERGRELADRMDQERVERLEQVLGRMEAADRESLLRGLRAFVQAAVLGNEGVVGQICLHCGLQASDNCPVASVLHTHISP